MKDVKEIIGIENFLMWSLCPSTEKIVTEKRSNRRSHHVKKFEVQQKVQSSESVHVVRFSVECPISYNWIVIYGNCKPVRTSSDCFWLLHDPFKAFQFIISNEIAV